MSKIFGILSRRETTLALTISLLLLLVLARDVAVDANPQKERAIENVPYGNEPIEPLEVKLSGKAIRFKEKIIDDNEDWLKSFSLKFKNKADKTIVFVEIALDFPETVASGPEMSYRLRLGRRPGGVNQTRPPLVIQPGESLNIAVADEYSKLREFVQSRQPISDISKVQVRVSFISFSDGTAWSAGRLIRADQSDDSISGKHKPLMP